MTARVVCSFCGATQWENRRVLSTWNVVWHQGKPVGTVCPDCQTPEENAEAEINLATLDIYMGTDGLGYARPKVAATRGDAPNPY